MSPSIPRIEMSGIHKRFGPTPALEDVACQVFPGEVHALVGENGAGKSTMGKIFSGACAPDAGIMRLDGNPYHPVDPLQARRCGVGMIYQELSLVPHLTVEENLFLGMEPTRGGFLLRREIRESTQAVLQSLQHPEIHPDQLVEDLSLGARQLVEIGRSLAAGCRVLILDEPTSSLTWKDVERLFAILRDLRRKNLSILYISHFLEEVERIADNTTILRDGKVVGTYRAADLTRDELIRKMVGREIRELYPRSRRARGAPLLEIRNLQGMLRPKNASLTLYRGEIVGIFGMVGSGRSEFLKTLFGLHPIHSGEIRMGVYSANRHRPPTPARSWKWGLGFLSEDRQGEGLAPHLSLADNLTLPLAQGWGWVLPNRQRESARRWIRDLAIHSHGPEQVVAELSGGNQQKVALARLLEADVDILLLDEPTRGIDVGAKSQIYDRIDRSARGKAILIVSSYLPELLGICDRIAVMTKGRLGATRPAQEVEEQDLISEATGEEAGA